MVQQEIPCSLSALIATLANGDAQPGSDLSALCDRALELSPIDSDVCEHWAVSQWLAERLLAEGEKVHLDFAGLNVWARQTRDQPLGADVVIMRIYATRA
jgi:hypothetical protein